MAVNLADLQKEVLRNKREKGFDTSNIAREFCRAHEELSEAFAKYDRLEAGVGEELADVVIFILGVCELLQIDLESELQQKIAKNKTRTYQKKQRPDGRHVYMRIRTPEDP